MKKYEDIAKDKIVKAINQEQKGTLKNAAGKKVTSKQEAVAIGLAEARLEAIKVFENRS